MLLTKFTYWFDSIQQRAASNKHRCLIVLSGEYSWSLPLLESIKNSPRSLSKKLNSDGIDQQDSWLIYSDSPKLKANVNKQNYRYKLGSESQVVVFGSQPTF